MADAAPDASPTFRKPKKKPNPQVLLSKKRKREELEVGEDDDVRELLEDTLLVQQDRKKLRGTIITPAETGRPSQSEEVDKDKQKSGKNSLAFAFTGATNEKSPLDQRMEVYIEEQLRLKREQERAALSKSRSENADQTQAKPAQEEALYETPEHLRVTSIAKPAETGTNATFFNALVEVELPVEYKLKNIEETAQARVARLCEGAPALPSAGATTLTPQPNVPQLHQRYRMKSTAAQHHSATATDDLVYEKFKKRLLHRA